MLFSVCLFPACDSGCIWLRNSSVTHLPASLILSPPDYGGLFHGRDIFFSLSLARISPCYWWECPPCSQSSSSIFLFWGAGFMLGPPPPPAILFFPANFLNFFNLSWMVFSCSSYSAPLSLSVPTFLEPIFSASLGTALLLYSDLEFNR